MDKIETERLVLRNFTKDDFDDLFEYISDKETVKFEPYEAMSESRCKEDLQWRTTCDEMIAMELKETGKVIGHVYMGNRDFESKELGYVLNKKFWHKGYAKEACLAVVEDAFKKGVHRVFAECDPLNENSWRLLEALGFEKEAYFKQNVYFWKDENGNPIWKDTFVYGKLK